jgi:hypothetical protein
MCVCLLLRQHSSIQVLALVSVLCSTSCHLKGREIIGFAILKEKVGYDISYETDKGKCGTGVKDQDSKEIISHLISTGFSIGVFN